MKLIISEAAWWGPPKKFDTQLKNRRVSWLELFYDLVYVIAISRITYQLTLHISMGGLLEYASLFLLIYWGWLNGSLYHDIHGNEGLRTRLMTLWQMMIIAALAITVEDTANRDNLTVVLMIMQVYVTYLWWSVGFYDRSHRKYNLPYTFLFLLSLALMGLSLVIPRSHCVWLVPLILIFNYMPPFISQFLLRRSSLDLDLTPSMFERLGLFTIIVFGEVVLGVVNGISATPSLHASSWLNFALALSIVFALWWIFFTLISNREVKKGFTMATLLELLFVPSLISLGLIAVCFTTIFDPTSVAHEMGNLFGYAVATFLISISLMIGLLEYPSPFRAIARPVRVSLLATAFLFILSSLIFIDWNIHFFLAGVLALLLMEILFLNSLYYRLVSNHPSSPNQE